MIGNRLKEIRTRDNLTLDALAQLIDSDARRVSLWENNRTSPSAEMLVKLARVLSISTDYLLGLTEDPSFSGLSSKVLNEQEWAVISAMRRGEPLEAVRAVVNAPADMHDALDRAG